VQTLQSTRSEVQQLIRTLAIPISTYTTNDQHNRSIATSTANLRIVEMGLVDMGSKPDRHKSVTRNKCCNDVGDGVQAGNLHQYGDNLFVSLGTKT
jgi:hypothetical protein